MASLVYDSGSSLTISFADFEAYIMTSYVAASALYLSDSTSAPSTALESIPASTRRRLSSYAKLLLAALFEVIEQHPEAAHAPVVLASRHGDLQRTIRLLNELVAGELLSPTQFCLSVNNAVLGQFSMLVDNQQGMTTVGAVPTPCQAAGLKPYCSYRSIHKYWWFMLMSRHRIHTMSNAKVRHKESLLPPYSATMQRNQRN